MGEHAEECIEQAYTYKSKTYDDNDCLDCLREGDDVCDNCPYAKEANLW